MEWNSGNILRGRNGSDAIHPIIFLEGRNDGFFIGAMITSSGLERYPENIPMGEYHFIKLDESGQRYTDYYGPSYLVDAKLLKRIEWRPFRKTGQLSEDGIKFVNSKIGEKYPRVWEDYCAAKTR